MKVVKNDVVSAMDYAEICKELGFVAETNFVRITSKGTVSYTAGKPEEVKALYASAIKNGYKPSRALAKSTGSNSTICDGWHELACGYAVYTVGGRVYRATKDDGQLPAQIYKPSPEGGWTEARGMKYETFLKGWREDRCEIF